MLGRNGLVVICVVWGEKFMSDVSSRMKIEVKAILYSFLIEMLMIYMDFFRHLGVVNVSCHKS